MLCDKREAEFVTEFVGRLRICCTALTGRSHLRSYRWLLCSITNAKPEDFLLTRRQMLNKCGMGMGALMLGVAAAAGARHALPRRISLNPLLPEFPQFAGKAKRVIHLFMNGGPSHVDTFDPKPLAGKICRQAAADAELQTERKTGAAFPSPFKFKKYGQSGIEVSDLYPHLAQVRR